MLLRPKFQIYQCIASESNNAPDSPLWLEKKKSHPLFIQRECPAAATWGRPRCPHPASTGTRPGPQRYQQDPPPEDVPSLLEDGCFTQNSAWYDNFLQMLQETKLNSMIVYTQHIFHFIVMSYQMHLKRPWCWERLTAEKRTEDEMVGCHHQLDGQKFE